MRLDRTIGRRLVMHHNSMLVIKSTLRYAWCRVRGCGGNMTDLPRTNVNSGKGVSGGILTLGVTIGWWRTRSQQVKQISPMGRIELQ